VEDILKYMIIGLLGFTAFIGCLVLAFNVFGPDRPERPPIEPSSSARLIDVGNTSFNLHVVNVDGVDYVVSTTYRGVGICPKVVKEEN
jgi:hypothetical protein